MTVEVRLADLSSDKRAIITSLHEHLNSRTNEKRFDWLYLDNPDGAARIWVIEEASTGRIVGSTALLPRMLYLAGKLVMGSVVADTWVHPDHRVLGPALKLQRACLHDIVDGRYAMAYDFPRQAMPAIYKRLGYPAIGTLEDYSRPIRFDSYISKKFGNSSAAKLIAAPANWVAVKLLRQKALPHIELQCESDLCGEEYNEFDRKLCGDTMRVARSACYLNWRYHKHFNLKHKFVVARRRGALAGFVVTVIENQRATIVDIAFDSPDIGYALIVQVGRNMAELNVQALQVSATTDSPIAPILRRLQFQPVSSTPLVVVTSSAHLIQAGRQPLSFMLGNEAD